MKIIRILFLILILITAFFGFKNFNSIESEVISAFSSSGTKSEDIKMLSKLSSNKLNIILEADNKEDLYELKADTEEFLNSIQKNADYSKIADIYKNYDGIFLSKEKRELILDKNYKELDEESLALLYNPLGLYIAPVDIDPYLFNTDYFLGLSKLSSDYEIKTGGKFYALIQYNLGDKKDLIKILEFKKGKDIYLSGSPIHSYTTSEKSKKEINIICLISTFALIFLIVYFLKSYKILIPVFLSIAFGILNGFLISSIVFKNIHILTFVFSTSLIGIGLDYSLHYFLTGREKGFQKSLFISLISTIAVFMSLYFSDIEVLRQISVFVISGLISVYLFVRIILPLIKFEKKETSFELINLDKFKTGAVFLIVLSLTGFFNFHFDCDIKNLYKPTGELLAAENLFQKFNITPLGFIVISGNNTEEILQKEEKITEKLNGDYISLSRFIPSVKKQKENNKLIKGLYKERLSTYASFLDEDTIEKIKNSEVKFYNPDDFPLKDEFIKGNKSFIMTNIKTEGEISLQDEMTKILKSFSKKTVNFIWIIILILSLTLTVFNRKLFKIIIPPILGASFPVALLSFLNVQINAFHLVAFILVIGFSIDYSIFRVNGGKSSNLAVFISCISTVISFGLLAFCGFKPISSIGLVLSVGVFTSYILSLVLLSKETENI